MPFEPLRNPSRNSIFEAVVIFILIVVLLWFIVLPKQKVLSEVRGNIKQQETEFQQIETQKQQMTQLVSRMKQSKDDLLLVDEALPLDARITKVNTLLSSLVDVTGMQLASINVDNTQLIQAGDKVTEESPFKAKRAMQKIKLEMGVTGSVEQFRNLLQLIETNGRVIDVVSLGINKDENSSPSFTIKLITYSYVQ